MKTLLIIWHRRRAAHHAAMSYDAKRWPWSHGYNWHREWAIWHKEQVERLEK